MKDKDEIKVKVLIKLYMPTRSAGGKCARGVTVSARLLVTRSRVRGGAALERSLNFHDLLLFVCPCQGDILGMISVRRRGDERLQSFFVTIKIQSVIPVTGRLVP